MSASNDDADVSPYAGRWVARLGGRIVGQGGTPEQARRAAQRSRYKERVEIAYMPPAVPLPLSPLVERVHQILADREIYLVGGAVRDALLGKVSHDLDFVLPEEAIASARQVANSLQADFYILDESFDTARVIVRNQDARDFLDFSSFRSDKAASARPSTLETDLQGRDFTINSMAYDLRRGSILDPLNGGTDLRLRLIRISSPTSLVDDPIRVMRGVRLAAALEFKIDPSTRSAMKAAVPDLARISPERQRDELFKMLDGPRPDASIRALEMLGAFPYVLPELSALKGVQQSEPHVADVWEHTLSVVQHLRAIIDALASGYDPEQKGDLFTGLLSLRLGRYRQRFIQHFSTPLNPDRSLRALLLLAALYHDVSKPATRTVDENGRTRFFDHDAQGAEQAAVRGRALNLSNDEIARLQAIIANHMRFHFHVSRLEGEQKQPSRKAIYRLFRDAGDAGVDLMLLGLADLRGTRAHLLTEATWNAGLEVARVFLENYWEKPEEAVAPPRLLDGNELMAELELGPGPLLGQTLEAIREAQAVGAVTTREQAIQFARQWIAGKS